MSAASDHVLVQLAINSLGLGRAGYGEMGILSHRATWTERIRRYSSAAAGLVDWAADSPEGLAISAAFAQSPPPKTVAVLRAAGTVTQRYDIGVVAVGVGTQYAVVVDGQGVTDTTVSYTAVADLDFLAADVNTGTDVITEVAHGMLTGAGPYRLSTSGALPTGTGIAVDTNVWIIAPTADTYKLATSKANALANTAIDITAAGSGTHTLRRAQNDVICAQLVQGLNAVPGANYTAVQTVGAGETDTVRVTANAPNNWFSLAVTNVTALSLVQSHAAPSDVTLATDLANILSADQAWYCLITLYNSAAYVLAAAAWVESNGRVYVFDSADTQIRTVAISSGTDIGQQLNALGYKRTSGAYYSTPAAMDPAAWMGRWLPTLPGKASPKFKTLAGVAGLTDLTDTHKTNIRARRMNSYEQVLPDRAFTWEGTVFSTINKFLDITRNSDWLTDETTKALLGVFVGSDIVPMSPEGITMLEGALRGVGTLAENQGVLLPGWSVIAPVFEELQIADIENRNLVGLQLQGRLRSPIHKAIPVAVLLTF